MTGSRRRRRSTSKKSYWTRIKISTYWTRIKISSNTSTIPNHLSIFIPTHLLLTLTVHITFSLYIMFTKYQTIKIFTLTKTNSTPIYIYSHDIYINSYIYITYQIHIQPNIIYSISIKTSYHIFNYTINSFISPKVYIYIIFKKA